MFRFLPAAETRRRLPRLLLGLAVCGIGLAFLVLSELGLDPWDVFHQGVAERTGITIGVVAIITGAVVVLAWLPLRERIGLGTILNVLVIGTTMDVILALLDPPGALAGRWAYLIGGTVLFGLGSGFYIGAGLGPGPRDGLMTALAARGHSVRVVRTGIEVCVLAVGFALGGTVGIGTVIFAASVGPLVHFFLHRLTMDPVEPPTVVGAE